DRARGEAGHWWPELLPGGHAVLYTVTPTTGGLDAASIAARRPSTSARPPSRRASERRPAQNRTTPARGAPQWLRAPGCRHLPMPTGDIWQGPDVDFKTAPNHPRRTPAIARLGK